MVLGIALNRWMWTVVVVVMSAFGLGATLRNCFRGFWQYAAQQKNHAYLSRLVVEPKDSQPATRRSARPYASTCQLP